jgi:hypothetical protein
MAIYRPTELKIASSVNSRIRVHSSRCYIKMRIVFLTVIEVSFKTFVS